MLDVIRYEREENPIRLDFAPIKSESDITNVNNRRGTMMSSHYLEVCKLILINYLEKSFV
jgi:hypothetical protein